jgi:hypothetical protein
MVKDERKKGRKAAKKLIAAMKVGHRTYLLGHRVLEMSNRKELTPREVAFFQRLAEELLDVEIAS